MEKIFAYIVEYLLSHVIKCNEILHFFIYKIIPQMATLAVMFPLVMCPLLAEYDTLWTPCFWSEKSSCDELDVSNPIPGFCSACHHDMGQCCRIFLLSTRRIVRESLKADTVSVISQCKILLLVYINIYNHSLRVSIL